MIKIALLDDDGNQLEIVKEKVEAILNEKKQSFKCDLYTSLENLNKNINSKEYDIFLLNIKLDNKKFSSIDMGVKINKLYPNAQIIFVSNNLKYFTEVYACKHIYCLLKDELDKRLPLAFDMALNNLHNNDIDNILVKTNHKTIFISANNIIYMEKSLRKIIFILKDKTKIETYGVFKDYENKLPNSFLQVHRSYIINTLYIKDISSSQITLLNGDIIPISRSYKKSALNDLTNKH